MCGSMTWQESMGDVLEEINRRLPEDITVADLERVLDEMEADQRERHERELGEKPPPWSPVSVPPYTGDRWGIWPLLGAAAVFAVIVTVVIAVWA